MSRPPANLGGRVAAGAVWALLQKALERGLGLVSTLILARLLVPEDFGLVAIATSFVALLELLRMFGFDMALIQLRQVTRSHMDTAWTFAAVLGLGIAAMVALLAPLAADFYGDPRLAPVLWALALSAAFSGLESNGPVLLRRELQWRKDFIFQTVRKLAAVAFTIPLAFLWRNYWALVVGAVMGRFASLVASYLISPQRPRFSLAARADLWSFSKWVFINNILLFLQQRLPNLIMGRLSSAASVGYFGMARDIGTIPTMELVMPINRAAFPGYAKIAHDPERLRSGFLKMLGAIALLVLPAGVGVALTSELIVRVFLGDKWLPSVPAMQVLSMFGAMYGLQSNANAAYLALGRARLQTAMMAVFIVVLVPALLLLTPRYAQTGAAVACFLAAAVAVPLNLLNVCRCLGIPFRNLLQVLWRPVLSSLAMAAAVTGLAGTLPVAGSFAAAAAQLAILVTTGGLSYLVVDLVLWVLAGRPTGAERWVLEKLASRLRRSAGR